ncbi:MAG: Hpt domain-containing protein [Anaerostipes sp.]|jgi:HPt (histidine-containing phosphotransfer) domain-containing protein|nr:Hpt domain-containing protein [Anaerostipes sp.]
MEERMKQLRDYGADVDGALERFVDDTELYIQCLEAFDEEEAFGLLGKAIEEKEYEEAFNQAHTLKGVAGNLGLTPLFDMICDIVEPLRSKDYSDLDKKYKDVMDAKEVVSNLLK